MTCTNCGKELEDGVLFCDACGTKILQEAPQAEAPVEETTYVEQEFAPEEPVAPAPKSKKTLFAILAGVVAVVAIVVIALLLFGGKGNTTLPTLYVKDKDMFIAAKGEPWQVTDDLGKTWADYTVLAPNGKTLFYADKLDGSDTPIYFRDISKEGSEAVKLDTNIDLNNFAVSKNSKNVVYLKDGALYRHDLVEKTKVASDVADIRAYTEDLKKVVYTTKTEKEDEKPDLYIDNNGESEKLASEVSSVEFINEKCTVVYYTSDDVLYKLEVGGEKEKIDSDVSNVVRIYESGEMYYYKSEKQEVKEGEIKYETEVYTLFYHDGNEAVSLAEDLSSQYGYRTASEAAVMIYTETTPAKEEGKDPTYTTYLVVEGTATELEFEGAKTTYSDCRITKDGKTVYYTDNYNEKDKTYELYKMAISGDAPEAAELYDSDIAATADEYSANPILSIYSDGTVLYGKELKDGAYDLYIDQELVEYDVKSYTYHVDDETIVYSTDYDTKDGKYTLNIWVKGKTTKVAEEVDDHQYCNNGKLIYLADCNDKGKGDLYEYRKGSSEKLDEDVTYIVPCYMISYDD